LLYDYIGLSFYLSDRTCFIPQIFFKPSDFDESQMQYVSACFWKVGKVNHYEVNEFPSHFHSPSRSVVLTDYSLSIRILRRVRTAFPAGLRYFKDYVEMLDNIEAWFSNHELSSNLSFKRLLYDLRSMKVNIYNVGPMYFFGREKIEEILLTKDKELTKFVYVKSFDIIKDEVLDIW
jgi:hypothetical protein